MKSNINCFLVRVLIILFFAAIPGQLCARGGGGCFLAGTPILLADGSKKNIEDIRIGDRLLTSSSEGVAATAAVRNIFSLDVDEYLEVRIDGMMLRVTREHPFCAGNGQFRTIGSLTAGDTVYAFNGSSLEKKKILSITTVREKAIVYNLSADQPNTFVAGGILVHNKGGGHGGGGHGGGSHSGGGFGGGYHGGFSGRTSGSSASSGDAPDEGTAVLVVALFFFIGYVLYKVIIAGEPGSSEKKEPNGSNGIDRLVDAKSIERRAVKARMILEKIDPLEKGFEEQNLKSVAKKAFLTLQKAWEARDYGPMSGLATKSLRARHEAQIAGLKRNHEINKIDDLAIQGTEIVQVCYAPDRKIREFAAWIDATARDFYIDDRSRSYLRGDTYRARFQEIYVFRMDAGGAWLLSGIEQTKETRKLNSKNLFKPQSAVSSGQTAIAQGAQAAPRDAHTRIERELDKLARHDASWNRELMTDFASTLATKVYMHREGGPFPPSEALSDEMAAMLGEEDKSRKKDGISVEFRNFCVRECHVSSYRMSACPEFTASISIHAQCRVLRNGVITHEDEDLRVFIERWTFRKTARNWMLAKITAKNRDSAPV
jgi:predicted lipid-binding transport protein (Tim44 family)